MFQVAHTEAGISLNGKAKQLLLTDKRTDQNFYQSSYIVYTLKILGVTWKASIKEIINVNEKNLIGKVIQDIQNF